METGLEASQDITILDISTEPATLTIGGAEYTIRRLTIGDKAAIKQRIIDGRMDTYIKALETRPLADDVLSKGLEGIVCRPVSEFDIFKDVDGERFMLERAVSLNGSSVKAESLPPLDRRILTHLLLYATKTAPGEGATYGPFEDGSRVVRCTPTNSSPSDGTNASNSSVANIPP